MKGVIFDFDGTLIDSLYIWEILAYDYLKGLGIDVYQDVYKDLDGMNIYESSAYIHDKYKLDRSERQITEDFVGIIEDYYKNKFELKPGVRNFIEKLYRKGIKMCIGSVSNKELIKPCLERLEVDHYFQFIQTEETAKISKRSPKFYIEMSRKLGLFVDEVIVFEDALYSIKSAKIAGFKIVAVEDEHNRDDRKEIEALADVYVKTFDDLEVARNGEIINNSRF